MKIVGNQVVMTQLEVGLHTQGTDYTSRKSNKHYTMGKVHIPTQDTLTKPGWNNVFVPGI